jgi:uncharacterized protein
MTIISSQRTIGSIVYVDSANASILLNNDLKSSLYADTGSLTLISQVGGYLLFPCGVGEYIVGILASAYEKEEPNFKIKDDDSFTLHLSESKRTLRTNLLGTLVSSNNKFCFKKGISVYPALGSEALIPSHKQIDAILNYQIEEGKENDLLVTVGESPIYTGVEIKLSLQNLFAFCLGIIGNTGSGKSFTVASLIQSAIRTLKEKAKENNKQAKPKFIILDINGEYSNAFEKKEPEKGRETNHAYLNGEDFKLPLWAFENDEICKLFRASPQVQTPTLEKLIDNLRSKEKPKDFSINWDIWGLESLQGYLEGLYSKAKIKNEGRYVGLASVEYIESIKNRTNNLLEKSYNVKIKEICKELQSLINTSDLINTLITKTKNNRSTNYEKLPDELRELLEAQYYSLENKIEGEIQALKVKEKKSSSNQNTEKQAIKPTYFDIEELEKGDRWRTVFKTNQDEDDSFESSKVHENTIGLRMRIRKFISELRYQVFRDNDKENKDDEIKNYSELVNKIISPDEAITVIDCSMLNKEVLPFFCAVIGRILLSERESRPIDERSHQPWCLVLEEAHNYVRPYREGEGSELRLCRQVFERIAKEGRKFGLSLVVASQRPSEISDTILSQCANFIVHRLQNPDDIDHFKKILPSGSREILDQVSILKSGETLIMGTSSNVPLKVQITLPTPKPHSESPNLADKWIL